MTTHPSTPASRTTAYGGHTLTWEPHSEGEHTFIMLHGHANARTMWLHTLEPFFPLGRWVTLDLPGHYPACAPHSYHTLSQDELLEMEMHAIEEISGGKPVTLLGHSTGGLIALAVAARRPELVERVVSINSVVWGPLTGFLQLMIWLLHHKLYRVFWAIVRLAQAHPRIFTLMVSTLYARQQQTLWDNPLTWQEYRGGHQWFRHHPPWNLAVLLETVNQSDIRPLITGLETPVLAITGALDPVVSPDQTRWLARHLPNVELHVLSGVGHIPNLEATKKFRTILEEWLRWHPTSPPPPSDSHHAEHSDYSAALR